MLTVINFRNLFPGQGDDNVPRFTHFYTTNTLAEVEVAGSLDAYVKAFAASVEETDWIFVTASDGKNAYSPSFGVDHSITLNPIFALFT